MCIHNPVEQGFKYLSPSAHVNKYHNSRLMLGAKETKKEEEEGKRGEKLQGKNSGIPEDFDCSWWGKSPSSLNTRSSFSSFNRRATAAST
jgi:hypothetical protein